MRHMCERTWVSEDSKLRGQVSEDLRSSLSVQAEDMGSSPAFLFLKIR